MKRFVLTILPPLLCVGMLAGMWLEAGTRLKPQDAEPYHARSKAALDAMPYQLNGWIGRDEEIPQAAVTLLRPNVMMCRTYVDPTRLDRSAGLLVVQCRDSRDMIGHYPPVCYPANGMVQTHAEPRDWDVGGMTVNGTEYRFAHTAPGPRYEMVVYNFMIVPGQGFVRDMDGVGEAAADYQQRYFGAAQFQVTMSANHPRPERDRIFAALIGANRPVIETLMSGGIER